MEDLLRQNRCALQLYWERRILLFNPGALLLFPAKDHFFFKKEATKD